MVEPGFRSQVFGPPVCALGSYWNYRHSPLQEIEVTAVPQTAKIEVSFIALENMVELTSEVMKPQLAQVL